MRVLQIGSDRSKRGILHPHSPAIERQIAYGAAFGELDIIGFSRLSDGAAPFEASPHVRVYPTNSSSRLFYGRDAIKIARFLPRPNVVSAQDPFEAGLAAWLIARRRNVPLHIQIHTDLLSPGYASHSFVNRLRVLIAGFVLKRAARIRVVSERTKRDMVARFDLDVPIMVLPIFVDVEKLRSARQNTALAARFERFRTKVLVVSRLEPEKNIGLAIRAFAEASPAGTCMIVVGEGSERVNLAALACALHVEDRVFFEGERTSSAYYKIADLVLVPSRYEGYGLVIVEALASGVPVISTDVGAACELGAIISNEKDFAMDLKKWFANGPREGVLKSYPYKNFEEYVRAYCDDIVACVKR